MILIYVAICRLESSSFLVFIGYLINITTNVFDNLLAWESIKLLSSSTSNSWFIVFRYDHNYRSLLFKLLTFTPNSWQHCVTVIITDEKWCYIVFWILPQSLLTPIRCGNLKSQLLFVCLCTLLALSLFILTHHPASLFLLCICWSFVALTGEGCYMVKFISSNLFCGWQFSRWVLGLININLSFANVTHVLCELELVIQRVKISTTPDGRVMYPFFITDSM